MENKENICQLVTGTNWHNLYCDCIEALFLKTASIFPRQIHNQPFPALPHKDDILNNKKSNNNKCLDIEPNSNISIKCAVLVIPVIRQIYSLQLQQVTVHHKAVNEARIRFLIGLGIGLDRIRLRIGSDSRSDRIGSDRIGSDRTGLASSLFGD